MGKTPVYLTDFLIKVDAGSKLDASEGIGVQGFVNQLTMIKSRNNRAGQQFELIFDQNRGFDNIWSNFQLLKSEKKIGGAGRSFYLLSCPDIKFSQKDFKKKLRDEEELRNAYIVDMKEILESYIYNPNLDDKSYDELNEDMDLDEIEIEYDEDVVEEKPNKKKK